MLLNSKAYFLLILFSKPFIESPTTIELPNSTANLTVDVDAQKTTQTEFPIIAIHDVYCMYHKNMVNTRQNIYVFPEPLGCDLS